MRRAFFLAAFALACDSTPPPPSAVVADFDLHADLTNQDSFWSMPYPSDLRLTPQGTPDLTGFPNNLEESILDGLKQVGMQRAGFPQMPAAYFHFSGPIAPQDPTAPIAAASSSPILLVDVDASSPDRGKLFPVVAGTPAADRYLLDDMLEIAPRVGVVLAPKRQYAFVVQKSLHDATGAPLGAPDAFVALEGQAPAADPELAAWKLYQPLWATLGTLGLDPANVAAATVFTTGDVVQETADLSDEVIAKYQTSIAGLTVPSGGDQPRFCELTGTVSFPQFQTGTPPFDTGGLFTIGSDGLPEKQSDLVVPMAISIPKGQMPQGGWPLVLYFHGSGGISTQIFDAEAELDIPGKGPAYVLSPHGFAMAASALPLNPERVPGASDLEYLNFNNPASFPFTFRQGVFEQRMFIDALSKVAIDPSIVASCTGLSLPSGETAYHFAMTPLHAQGQSMGGMYANLVSAVEPRIKIVVPTGAGGDWPYMVLTTNAIQNAPNDLKLLLGSGDLTFMHPALQLLETAWEPAEPFVYMPRLAKSPLAGNPARPIYEPVGQGDEYFSTGVYDGAALAYGNREAGDTIWPTMQATLAIDGLDGIVPYPIATQSHGTVVQWQGDGTHNAHYIALTVDGVKYQYACFHESFQKTGTATVYAPQPADATCP